MAQSRLLHHAAGLGELFFTLFQLLLQLLIALAKSSFFFSQLFRTRLLGVRARKRFLAISCQVPLYRPTVFGKNAHRCYCFVNFKNSGRSSRKVRQRRTFHKNVLNTRSWLGHLLFIQ